MAKVDCGTVIGFAQEANRVCELHEKCEDCPFTGKKKCPMSVLEYDNPDIQGIIDSLQKWSDEHPVKTRLDDLLEKYPNVPLNGVGTPRFDPWMLGYCDKCSDCPHCIGDEYCWHEPVDGGATGKAVSE